LLAPFGRGRDGAKLLLRERITAAFESRQEQDFLLQVRRQRQQIHDLRQPGAGDVPEPS